MVGGKGRNEKGTDSRDLLGDKKKQLTVPSTHGTARNRGGAAKVGEPFNQKVKKGKKKKKRP